jgi:hypothetical protein
MTEVHYFGHNLRSVEAMTMNFCEQKLDQIRSNFDRDHLVQIFSEQGQKFKQAATLKISGSSTSRLESYNRKHTQEKFHLEST